MMKQWLIVKVKYRNITLIVDEAGGCGEEGQDEGEGRSLVELMGILLLLLQVLVVVAPRIQRIKGGIKMQIRGLERIIIGGINGRRRYPELGSRVEKN